MFEASHRKVSSRSILPVFSQTVIDTVLEVVILRIVPTSLNADSTSSVTSPATRCCISLSVGSSRPHIYLPFAFNLARF
jgi:hypothetical protein